MNVIVEILLGNGIEQRIVRAAIAAVALGSVLSGCQETRENPAVRIMSASIGGRGNLRIDSTR